jgi:hypothetical protein
VCAERKLNVRCSWLMIEVLNEGSACFRRWTLLIIAALEWETISLRNSMLL